jgi:tRNA/tmRNA/rRNA uracil-C5-methylase (TrmA/RlmC/RlmD family)
VHVVVDDDGQRQMASTARGRRGVAVTEGTGECVQRVGSRVWRVPMPGFWQSHRDAAATYSALITQWARETQPAHAWDLYGGSGLFAAALAEVVGETGQVLTVDTSRTATATARAALADLPQVQTISGSVRHVVAGQSAAADIAVLDPPRSGAGREVIDLLACAGVPRVIHIGCEAAAFARDVGLYRANNYRVESIRVFDAFPLTHHVECIALLEKADHVGD